MYRPPARRRITPEERCEVYGKCDGHCAYCGSEITLKQMQVDHVIPMEFWESYAAIGENIDTVENMLPACRSCNNYKSSMTLEKFRKAIERWPDVLMRDSVTYKNAVRYGQVIPSPKNVVFYFERMASGPEEGEK